MSTDHNPDRRREASADPRVRRRQQLDLGAAAPGKNTWGKWTPVRGPHLKTVRTKFSRNTTGVPGISLSRIACNAGGKKYLYFYVQLGRATRRFNITTLGKSEAWRRALKCRADHELSIRNINAAILDARQKSETSHA